MRHALITAGSKGLGKKVAEALLNHGYSLTINYKSDEEAVRQLKHDWRDNIQHIQFVKGDVTKKEDLVKLVKNAYERFGRIDVLILNAGPYVFERKKLVDYTDDEWDEMVSGNLSSAFHLFKCVIPYMRDQQYGRIITYGFQDAQNAPGWLYRSAFAAAKAGLVSLTKTISIEEAEHGITANMVCPGKITGDMKEASIQDAVEDKETPVGRSGTGEDIARTVMFLCAPESDMITGSVLEVTGGINVLHKYR
ncbi:SDR family oxidoreductase [Salipaludibacillus agaradhaerens]|jgi:3-oxoacyl-[acyl-carrier protein] reductase|uniref:SDR family oxidoreductase n=1 Tax=Salipaludibacillus agaradhaerens TaxID=76935 RepID=A0A9Q4AZJ5_SALAG|nr:SDR family oxidoreductase [Salipaludibacillus agaradhaerens]MCR6095528.1 SDR family oxidoreductase [Salipaludibacillus agaradhaerens]MCR6114912.1 SDR family oxidoreductase [Salipaludibacillus agaradhaerens]